MNENIMLFLKQQIPQDYKIIYEYTGPFEQAYIKEQAINFNNQLKDFPQTQKKIFYTFIELAQNVGFYSEEKQQINEKQVGIGTLIVYENDKNFGFIIANKIKKDAYEVLAKKCKIINELDRESLRELKRFQRNLLPGMYSNAHVGLIMVALTIRKPLVINSIDLDSDHKFFNFDINVEKEKF